MFSVSRDWIRSSEISGCWSIGAGTGSSDGRDVGTSISGREESSERSVDMTVDWRFAYCRMGKRTLAFVH